MLPPINNHKQLFKKMLNQSFSNNMKHQTPMQQSLIVFMHSMLVVNQFVPRLHFAMNQFIVKLLITTQPVVNQFMPKLLNKPQLVLNNSTTFNHGIYQWFLLLISTITMRHRLPIQLEASILMEITQFSIKEIVLKFPPQQQRILPTSWY